MYLIVTLPHFLVNIMLYMFLSSFVIITFLHLSISTLGNFFNLPTRMLQKLIKFTIINNYFALILSNHKERMAWKPQMTDVTSSEFTGY